MARTVRDLAVPMGPGVDVDRFLTGWLASNGFTIIDPRSDGAEKKFPHWDGSLVLHPKPGSLVATQTRAGGATIVFELTLSPVGGSRVIHFEGYTTGRGPGWGGKEFDFIPSALAVAGVPRKRGLELLTALQGQIASMGSTRFLPNPPPSPTLGSISAPAPPAPLSLEQLASQQMIFVYVVLAGGFVFLVELLVLAVTSHHLDVVVELGGGGAVALCFGGAYWMRRGIRNRIESIRAGTTTAAGTGISASVPSVADPGFCPACGAANASTVAACVACQAPLASRESFLLESSRTEADIRRLQLLFGGMALFFLVLLAWALSPLTRAGRDFEAAVLGMRSFADAPSGTFLLLLMGPMSAWILWQALTIRRSSGPGELIVDATGVTVFDDSRHRFHLPWGDPEFSMVFQDTHGNPMFTRQTIFMKVPRKGNGGAIFPPTAFGALESAAKAHGLSVSERTDQLFGSGPVRAITISPSVLPVFTDAFPRPR
ncbi:MAG: zinc finger Ran-binding domain-containing protein [Thermoplasmata archaeon]|nr:zinc finger Ran-binding domain-containing protein [Thermoplasmata archaeon]